MREPVTVIGAGLAGCEAAWQLAQAGIPVVLREMKPRKKTPAHHADLFGSWCAPTPCARTSWKTRACSRRSCGGWAPHSPVCRRAPGAAGAPWRWTGRLRPGCHRRGPKPSPHHRGGGEVTALPETGQVIVATGPLTADALAGDIARRFPGSTALHFYDAAAPLVTFESIDMDSAWLPPGTTREPPITSTAPDPGGVPDLLAGTVRARRPLSTALRTGTSLRAACRWRSWPGGEQTLCYGPLKPRGLRDPKTGREPYAVVQLRRDNAGGSIYNLVGFQTHLTWPEQKRVFSLIPALRQAEFVRYGVMHRNTYLDSPRLLDRYYRVRTEPRIVFAGQITGVEGYVESTASGFVAALELARRLEGKAPIDFPPETALGALALYVSNETVEHFQPMNINFGIMPPLGLPGEGETE
ncbi:MAG: methylenetetrahydrofolate--tRNA-(uracil(54)-C(5))-methyltransferase (FADH(2)-oxidizing) TrmFO [Evtepia gabavorous]